MKAAIRFVAMLLLAGAGCHSTAPESLRTASVSQRPAVAVSGRHDKDEDLPGIGEAPGVVLSAQPIVVSDPLEPVNRLFFQFNDKLYFWVLKPVASRLLDAGRCPRDQVSAGTAGAHRCGSVRARPLPRHDLGAALHVLGPRSVCPAERLLACCAARLGLGAVSLHCDTARFHFRFRALGLLAGSPGRVVCARLLSSVVLWAVRNHVRP